MGSTYTVHNDTKGDVYMTHGAQKWWKENFPIVREVEAAGASTAYDALTGDLDKRKVSPGDYYRVNCTLSLVNSVYFGKSVIDRNAGLVKIYRSDMTVWSGATANSNNDYYVSNCDWEFMQSVNIKK